MKTQRGIQGFIESKAEGPAFAIVAASMILRASQFYSGGQLVLAHLLGTQGMAVFNMASGIGLAFGCELLASVAGRQWRTAKNEALEARGRSGMKRSEREALIARFESAARIAYRYMWIGLIASFGAAFWYVASAGTSHTWESIAGEILVTALLVAVVSFFGIFKDASADDPSEHTAAQAVTIRSEIVDAAGRRIANGTYAEQDVRIVAKALPKMEREKFEAALIPASPDDPHWTARDIAQWLDCDTSGGRRQIARKLAKLHAAGAGVQKDDKGAYAVPRSVVVAHFAEDYVAIHASDGIRNTPRATVARQNHAPNAVNVSSDSDSDKQVSGQGHAPESQINAIGAHSGATAAPALVLAHTAAGVSPTGRGPVRSAQRP